MLSNNHFFEVMRADLSVVLTRWVSRKEGDRLAIEYRKAGFIVSLRLKLPNGRLSHTNIVARLMWDRV